MLSKYLKEYVDSTLKALKDFRVTAIQFNVAEVASEPFSISWRFDAAKNVGDILEALEKDFGAIPTEAGDQYQVSLCADISMPSGADAHFTDVAFIEVDEEDEQSEGESLDCEEEDSFDVDKAVKSIVEAFADLQKKKEAFNKRNHCCKRSCHVHASFPGMEDFFK